MILSLCLLVVSVVLIAVLLFFRKSFGAFTKSLLAVVASNDNLVEALDRFETRTRSPIMVHQRPPFPYSPGSADLEIPPSEQSA